MLAQIETGADWDETMTANEVTNGDYAVCESSTDRPADVVAAATALANAGDVSGKIRVATSGYYIVKYVEDVVEGPVDLETVREGIMTELLTAAQDEAYEAQVHAWVDAAGAKIDTKALNN